MCGIVGFTGKADSNILEKMNSSIKHRGPNDSAYIVSSNFSVGFRRLSIIDLTENIYPIKNETGYIELVLNGEIYNYQKLRDELQELGHVFKTKSDSEAIVHGYEEWGLDVLDKLRGMFVFVLYDKSKERLFIARDRLGIKPFYYSRTNGRVVFASEIKAILEGFNVDRLPSKTAIWKFLNYRVHDDEETTFFKNVKRLMPGHYMIITNSSSGEPKVDITKYWKPEFNHEFGSKKKDSDYAEEFKEIFTEAVRLHLIADVPVGVTLSGGLDSSGITALSKKLYDEMYPGQEIIAFSAVHPGEKIDESEYIDNVVNETGIKSVKIQPSVTNFWEDLEVWNRFQEEPVISGAPYAYFTVMREARKSVTVLLSGQGGDELLAGYIPYFMTYLHSAWDQRRYWSIIRESFMGRDLYFKYFWQKFIQKFNNKDQILPLEMLSNEFKNEFESNEFQFNYSRNLNERLFLDVTSTTTPSLLRYEDKNSMANSLESRVPFFDHKVVEYIFKLPIDQKIKFGWNRWIYRNALKGVMPEKNRTRRNKIGFTNPEWEWIERRADKFREIFSSDSFKSRPYWNPELVLSKFENALKGQLNGDLLIFWRIFSVEMWLREWQV